MATPLLKICKYCLLGSAVDFYLLMLNSCMVLYSTAMQHVWLWYDILIAMSCNDLWLLNKLAIEYIFYVRFLSVVFTLISVFGFIFIDGMTE